MKSTILWNLAILAVVVACAYLPLPITPIIVGTAWSLLAVFAAILHQRFPTDSKFLQVSPVLYAMLALYFFSRA